MYSCLYVNTKKKKKKQNRDFIIFVVNINLKTKGTINVVIAVYSLELSYFEQIMPNYYCPISYLKFQSHTVCLFTCCVKVVVVITNLCKPNANLLKREHFSKNK